MKSNVLKASLALLLAFTTLPISAQSEFYVSPEGKADGDGSARNPFNRIPAALEKARTEKGEIVIYLREGKYILDKPVVFHFAGWERHPAIIRKSLSWRTGRPLRGNTFEPAMGTL